jgi:hypothetical protein
MRTDAMRRDCTDAKAGLLDSLPTDKAVLRAATRDGRLVTHEAEFPLLLPSVVIPWFHDHLVAAAGSAPREQQPALLHWATAIRFWDYTRQHRPVRVSVRNLAPYQLSLRAARQRQRFGDEVSHVFADANRSPDRRATKEQLDGLAARASEIPAEVTAALIRSEFTPGLTRLLDDFGRIEREAELEADRLIGTQAGARVETKRRLREKQLAAWDKAKRCALDARWNRYRTRRNAEDPTLKRRLPDLKKEAAEWVSQAFDRAARAFWDGGLKERFGGPEQGRLYASYYTRQPQFANRILFLDETLWSFFTWSPDIQSMWLEGIVFRPESRRGQAARRWLALLWRAHVLTWPARREQKRADERERKRDARTRGRMREAM